MTPAAPCRVPLGRSVVRAVLVALALAWPLPAVATVDRTLAEAATALARGDDTNALRLLQEAAGLAPDTIGVLVPLARLQLRTGDLAAAEATAEEALAAHPDHAPMLALLGDVLRASDRLAEAEHAYALALEADPDEPTARAGHARLALAVGDVATVDGLDIPADDRSLALRLAWADAEANRGELRRAIAKLDDLLRQNPGWMDALLRRGDYARQLGDLATAHHDLERAVELDPLSAEARYRRGLLRR
ncbi:MAG: tetratricopeptide repeat protein, partial [Pseudomonadota bacterium]